MDRIRKLKEFLEQSPADPFLMHALGLEYRKAGEGSEAIHWFNRVMAEHPDYVGTYYQAGLYWLEQGDQHQARQVFEKGLEVATRVGDRHAQGELKQILDEWND